MSNQRTIIKGTLILTVTGLFSRFIGFFYRMFLSHAFGEELVGLYQLIFPIYALCYSFTVAGIETSISRSVAYHVKHTTKETGHSILCAGLFLSLGNSILVMYLLIHFSMPISIHLLGDLRCKKMLVAIAYSIPFASIHSCICGYYFGLKETTLPAISQLLEQLARVSTVFLLYHMAIRQNGQISILFAAIGLAFGEVISSLFCIEYYFCHHRATHTSGAYHIFRYTKELLTLSVPLTANRVLLNILQSIEAISIPLKLQIYGYSNADALATYGVLTGMALPCVLFPSAATNALSTMLLPTVAELQSTGHSSALKKLIRKTWSLCFILGLFCCLMFLLFGKWAGLLLFHSSLAGDFLLILAWICPFLYTNTALISIINGLGNATFSFFINMLSLLIRIIGILFFIPRIGMNGYLWSLLLSQLFVTVGCLSFLLLQEKKGAS